MGKFFSLKLKYAALLLAVALYQVSFYAYAAPSGSQMSSCGGIEAHAHRGHYAYPENSLSSVTEALRADFAAPEFDVQRLSDGRWVLQHDLVLGRTIAVSGSRACVPATKCLTSTQWSTYKLKDRHGMQTYEHAAFLDDVLNESNKIIKPWQRLNIEIKGTYSCPEISELVNLVRSKMPGGSFFFTSLDLNALSCVRRLDKSIYLGVVRGPDADALKEKYSSQIESGKNFLERHGIARQRTNAALHRAEDKWTVASNAHLFNNNGLNKIMGLLGKPVGLHIEASELSKTPDLFIRAQKMGFLIYSYGYRGDDDLVEKALTFSRHASKPIDGLILDGSWESVCAQTGN